MCSNGPYSGQGRESLIMTDEENLPSESSYVGNQWKECDPVLVLTYTPERRCAVCWVPGNDRSRFYKIGVGFSDRRQLLRNKLLKYTRIQVDYGHLCKICEAKLVALDKRFEEFQDLMDEGARRRRDWKITDGHCVPALLSPLSVPVERASKATQTGYADHSDDFLMDYDDRVIIKTEPVVKEDDDSMEYLATENNSLLHTEHSWPSEVPAAQFNFGQPLSVDSLVINSACPSFIQNTNSNQDLTNNPIQPRLQSLCTRDHEYIKSARLDKQSNHTASANKTRNVKRTFKVRLKSPETSKPVSVVSHANKSTESYEALKPVSDVSDANKSTLPCRKDKPVGISADTSRKAQTETGTKDVTVTQGDENIDSEADTDKESDLELEAKTENSSIAEKSDKTEEFSDMNEGEENISVKNEEETHEDIETVSKIVDHSYSLVHSIENSLLIDHTKDEIDGQEDIFVYEADEIYFRMNEMNFVRTHTRLFGICEFCHNQFLVDSACLFEQHMTDQHKDEITANQKQNLTDFWEIKPFLLETERYHTLSVSVKETRKSLTLFGFVAHIVKHGFFVSCPYCSAVLEKQSFSDHVRRCMRGQMLSIPVDELTKFMDNLQKLETTIVRWPRGGSEAKRKRNQLNEEMKRNYRRLYTLKNSYPTVCDICGKTFKKYYLRSHIWKVHMQLHQCEKCGATVKDLSAHRKFTKHGGVVIQKPKIRIRNKNQKKKQCKQVKDALAQQIANARRKQAPAEICLQPYKSLEVGTVYVCEVCGKHSQDSKKLNEHKHKVYDCFSCDRRFATREILECHRQKHKDVEVTCQTCKQTVSSACLRVHKIVEHPALFNWMCTLCTKIFEEFSVMKRHMQSAHKADTTPDTVFTIPQVQIGMEKRTIKALLVKPESSSNPQNTTDTASQTQDASKEPAAV